SRLATPTALAAADRIPPRAMGGSDRSAEVRDRSHGARYAIEGPAGSTPNSSVRTGTPAAGPGARRADSSAPRPSECLRQWSPAGRPRASIERFQSQPHLVEQGVELPGDDAGARNEHRGNAGAEHLLLATVRFPQPSPRSVPRDPPANSSTHRKPYPAPLLP